MKTVYSRYQNAAAGKFAAAQSDIESENYNEEDWANLNDVETALGALGIKIRDSVANFREFDDVMDEIADKWNTYTDVQKSGIATALAGTRQRENVLTIFENWNAVEQYEEIAATAYGTAIQKMESYTESVEAAKTRMTVALEKWVLALGQSDTLIFFYNLVAEAADNLVSWIAAIATTTALLNSVGVGSTLQKVYRGFISSLTSVTLAMNRAKINFNGYFKQGGMALLGKNLKDNAEAVFSSSMKQNFAVSLTNTINSINTLGDTARQTMINGLIPVQNGLLSYERELMKNIIATMQDTSITEDQVALKLQQLLQGQNNLWVDSMLATMDQQELRQRTQELTNGTRALTAEEKLIIATEQLAKMRNTTAGKTIIGNMQQYQQLSPARAAAEGVASLGGGMGGAFAGNMIGKYLFDSDAAQSWGTMFGGVAGSYALNGIVSAIAKGLASKATIGAILGSAIAPIAALGTLIFATVIAVIKKGEQEATERAKKAFKETAEELNNVKSLSVVAKKYDELSKGVDSLGRNVTLTDEDYEKFLEYSNQLVEAFPELKVRTDENGNAIADMGDAMESTSDKVKGLIGDLQHLADLQLTSGEDGERVLKDTLNTVAEEQKAASDAIKEAQKEQTKANKTDIAALERQKADAEARLKAAKEAAANDPDNKTLEEKRNRINAAQKKVNNLQSRKNAGDATVAVEYSQALYELEAAQRDYNSFVDVLGEDSVAAIENEIATLETRISQATGDIKAADASVEAAVAAYDKTVASTKQTLAESGQAYARIMGAYDDVDTTTSNLLDDAIAAIDGVDANGVALTPEEYKTQVREMINSVNQLLADGTAKTLIEAADQKINTNMTVEDANKARQAVMDYLKKAFPNIEEDENMVTILLQMGFKIVDGQIVDDQNVIQKFKEKYGFSTNPNGVTEDYLNSLTVDEANKVFNWMGTEGYFSNGMNTNQNIIDSMLWADRNAPTALTGKTGAFNKYLEDMQGMSELDDRLKEFFYSDDFDPYTTNVYEAFADFPETVRNSIAQVQDALNNGELDENGLSDQLTAVYDNAYSAVLDQGKEIAETMSSQYFPDMELPSGYIKSWSELKEAFESVSSIFDQLADARTEMASSGQLSIETTLDLLSTNADYINALEIENERIVLKTDAEEIMNRVRLQTIAVSLQAQIQEDNLRVAQLKSQLQTLMMSGTYVEASDALVESTKTKVYAYGSEMEALAALSNAYLTAAQAASTLNRAQNGEVVDIGSVKAVDQIKFTPIDTSQLESKTIDLSGNSEALQQQIEATKAELRSLVGDFDEIVTTDKDGKVVGYNVKFKTHTDDDGSIHYDEGNIAMREHLYYSIQDMLDSGDLAGSFEKNYTNPIKEAGSSAEDTKDKVLDLLNAYDALIDKEWEAMKVFDEDTLTPTGYTKYFEKKRASLEKLAAYYEGMMQNTNLTEEERLDAEKNYIENQKAINNLDDEEVEDKYKILELYGASINSLILMKQQLVKTSDTYEELLENQKDLNSLLQDEIDLRKEVSEWQQNLTDRQLEYVKGTAWSNSTAYDDAMNASLAEIEKQIEATKASMQFNFSQAVYGYMTEGMSEAEARAYVALGNSEYSQRYREDQEKYLGLIDSQVEYVVNRTSAQIEELSNKLQLLEDSKPQEWIRISDIESYYASRSSLLQSQIEVYQKALEDVSDLTDEQIKDLVDGLNEATVALHEAEINALEDKTELQEKQYDAIVYRINLYKEELQDAIDAIEDAYEDEIKPLEDANKERERAIELENLLLAKKNANKEKERVYREGEHQCPRKRQLYRLIA